MSDLTDQVGALLQALDRVHGAEAVTTAIELAARERREGPPLDTAARRHAIGVTATQVAREAARLRGVSAASVQVAISRLEAAGIRPGPKTREAIEAALASLEAAGPAGRGWVSDAAEAAALLERWAQTGRPVADLAAAIARALDRAPDGVRQALYAWRGGGRVRWDIAEAARTAVADGWALADAEGRRAVEQLEQQRRDQDAAAAQNAARQAPALPAGWDPFAAIDAQMAAYNARQAAAVADGCKNVSANSTPEHTPDAGT